MKILIGLLFLGCLQQAKAQTSDTIVAKKITAQKMIDLAQERAKKSDKKVMVKYTATWCGWCHKMDTAMADASIAAYFDANYEVIRINVMESKTKEHLMPTGAAEMLKLQGGVNTGIPYWVILDKDNKILANSKAKADDKGLDEDGENVGCPAKDTEITYFTRVLKATGKFTDEAIQKIKTRFEAID